MKKEIGSILISLFKRKGGEGKYTKIVSDHNLPEGVAELEEEEISLIVYYKNKDIWFLLSDKKVRVKKSSNILNIDIQNIKDVNLAIYEEFKDGVKDKAEFTRLKIIDKQGNCNLISLEKGLPYIGIYQVLHFLASKN